MDINLSWLEVSTFGELVLTFLDFLINFVVVQLLERRRKELVLSSAGFAHWNSGFYAKSRGTGISTRASECSLTSYGGTCNRELFY